MSLIFNSEHLLGEIIHALKVLGVLVPGLFVEGGTVDLPLIQEGLDLPSNANVLTELFKVKFSVGAVASVEFGADVCKKHTLESGETNIPAVLEVGVLGGEFFVGGQVVLHTLHKAVLVQLPFAFNAQHHTVVLPLVNAFMGR